MDQMSLFLLGCSLISFALVGLVLRRIHRRPRRNFPSPGPDASKEEVEDYVFEQFKRALEADRQKTPEQREREEREANLEAGKIWTRMTEQNRVGQFSRSPGPWRRRRRY